MKVTISKRAFSLIELSVSVAIIGILAASIMSGKRIISQSALRSAQALTKNSAISSIPDLVFWVEPTLDGSITGATTGNNLSNNDLVSSWNDISGNKIKVTQGTTANQPQYRVSGINNLPSINFDGFSDVLYSTTVPISTGNGQYTMVAVWKSNAVSASSLMVIQKSATSISGANADIWLNGSSLGMSGFSNDVSGLGTIAAGVNYIYTMVVNNFNATNNISGYLNSNTATQQTSPNVSGLSVGNAYFSIGARVNGVASYSNYSNVLLSEVMVFNRNLKPFEITLINNYLSKKYNITVS